MQIIALVISKILVFKTNLEESLKQIGFEYVESKKDENNTFNVITKSRVGLIILDLDDMQAKEMFGIIEKIRENPELTNLPIITAGKIAESISPSVSHAHLLKPFTTETLRQTIDRAIERVAVSCIL